MRKGQHLGLRFGSTLEPFEAEMTGVLICLLLFGRTCPSDVECRVHVRPLAAARAPMQALSRALRCDAP